MRGWLLLVAGGEGAVLVVTELENSFFTKRSKLTDSGGRRDGESHLRAVSNLLGSSHLLIKLEIPGTGPPWAT